jgi:DNA-binding transcriptional ArsR family regulator
VAGGDGKNRLLTALKHPLRREIVRTMIGREQISSREMSELLETPLSNVSYHVNVLRNCDAIELVDTEPVRGAVQHFYRLGIDEPWALTVLGIQEDGDGNHGGTA